MNDFEKMKERIHAYREIVYLIKSAEQLRTNDELESYAYSVDSAYKATISLTAELLTNYVQEKITPEQASQLLNELEVLTNDLEKLSDELLYDVMSKEDVSTEKSHNDGGPYVKFTFSGMENDCE